MGNEYFLRALDWEGTGWALGGEGMDCLRWALLFDGWHWVG